MAIESRLSSNKKALERAKKLSDMKKRAEKGLQTMRQQGLKIGWRKGTSKSQFLSMSVS